MRLPLQWKILAGYLVVAVVSLGAAGWLALGVFESRDREHLAAGLTAQARLVGELFTESLKRIPPDMQQIDSLADRFGESVDARITVIAPDGKVLGDSYESGAGASKHGQSSVASRGARRSREGPGQQHPFE